MSAPASPEEFLREFAKDVRSTRSTAGVVRKVRAWTKLLELREVAARVDELQKLATLPNVYPEKLGGQKD